MPARLPLTDDERRERKRLQDRASYLRQRASGYKRPYRPRKQKYLSSRDHILPRDEPSPEAVAEWHRALAAPRDITSILMGDPPLGRRAIDHRENRT